MNIKVYIFAMILALFISSAYAQTSNTMTLLAVSEVANDTLQGSTAQLTLELIPGSGRVFLDTYPYSKIDTQISTRIAKDIACQFLQMDCSRYDFIYTIKSTSSIISGPSGSGAIAAITIATLDNKKPDPLVAMTGTINSGGIIGAVGGVKQKVEAAAQIGITTVLVPLGELNTTDDKNITTDMVAYGQLLGVRIIEVTDINQVMKYLTHTTYPQDESNISIPDFYQKTMNNVSKQLCDRTLATPLPKKYDESIYNQSLDLLNKSAVAYAVGDYYSAASFCYGAGISRKVLYYENTSFGELQNMSKSKLDTTFDLADYKTINDLQTYMAVYERVEEAKDLYNGAIESKNKYGFITAMERIESAKAWSTFAQGFGTPINLNQAQLQSACSIRLQEVEERKNYIEYYIPNQSEDELLKVQRLQASGQYELCIFSASKLKAKQELVLALFGVNQADLDRLIIAKAAAVKSVILRQTKAGFFPTIGYSYYEYGLNLAATDKYSAMLYLQYALELSNLDIYFAQKRSTHIVYSSEQYFLFGLLIGLIIPIISWRIERYIKTHPSPKRTLNLSRKKR